MPDLQASRRLVKSPPELWAEVSDPASLARHLGELGEIRITRLEPETAAPVAAEREREPEPEPEPEPPPVAEAPPEPARRRWLAKLLRRDAAAAPEPVADAEAPPPSPAPADDPLLDALTGALDSLGAAHHRPFSRG
jgi:hypothetical protein